MLKRLFLPAFFAILCPLLGNAQYANSWINFNQQYYRVPIAKDGIYRLTYSDLQTASVPLAAIDPRFIQLFHRGVQQAILVQGESDAHFDPGDYIEFYGKRNDGTLDAQLYKPSSLQPHPYYNLYSDTSSYFLTWTSVPLGALRMSNFFENNVTSIPKEIAHNDPSLIVYASEYSGGNTISNGEIQSTVFDEGEGWTDSYICTINSGCTGFKDYIVDNLLNLVPSAGTPKLELLIVGRDELNHQTQVWVGPTTGSLRLLSTQTFVDFQTQLVSSDLNWSDIGADGKMAVEVKALGVAGLRDRVSVSYIKVTAPQDFNLSGQTQALLTLDSNPSGKSYIEMTNPASALRLWDISNLNNVSTIGTNLASGILSAVVAGTTAGRKLFVSNEINTPALKAISFQQIDPVAYDYLIITHSTLLTASMLYDSYRASTTGGAYKTLTVTVDQLYNQFNYGEVSPLGIFNYVKFMVENGSPKYLFLIGKGRDVSSGYYRHPSGLADLVPSAGLPASDMAYSAGLLGSGVGPALATGRVSTSTPSQVIAYLNKIKEAEATPSNPVNNFWLKKGLHLSGGIQVQPINELVEFRGYLDGFEILAENPYWGAQITTIAKHDANAVQQINIADEVNAGVNLITFFGHSSPGTIDIDIGKVTDPTLGYNNPGKYPVFLINGCNAGNFFANGTSFGEDWMLAASRGARGFIAHSSFGFVSTLQQYSALFYSVGFNDSTYIKKGIGDVQKEIARQYIQAYGTAMADVSQVQQMVLLGDPAIKLFGTATPDYQTDDASVTLHSFDGKPVTALSDSFSIQVIVRNLGAARSGFLSVRVARTFNDNSIVNYDSIFPAPYFMDTLQITIRKGREVGYGNNQFKVILDYLNQFTELDETNNTGTLIKSIPLGGTKNLFPFPYAIVNKQNPDLILQCTDVLSDSRSFQVELDTVDSFNSLYLKHQVVTGKVLAKLPVILLPKDSVVYYWRTKLDQPKQDESTDWVVSSFTYISNSPEGWMQKQFGQLSENSFLGLVPDANSDKLKFVETSTNIHVKTYGANNPALYTDVSVKLDNAEFNLGTQGQPCRNNTINIIAFDKTSLVPYAGLPFSFQDPRTCGREPQIINSFQVPELETGNGDDFAAMVDAIHTSDSVLIFSIGYAGYDSWSSTLKAKMHELGILESQIASLQNGDPLIILGRKGAPAGTAKVFTSLASPAVIQPLEIQQNITGRYTSGKMNSVLIGPALSWKSLVSQGTMVGPSDTYQFSYYGVKYDGSQTFLGGVAGPVDLTSVDAKSFPYLKIELYSEDVVNLDPIQLEKWLVIYDPAPEGVLLFSGPTGQQTIGAGQSWSSPYEFVNISDKAFTDSLTVRVQILTSATLKKELTTFKIGAPLPGDTTHFMISTNTLGKAGLNDVDVFVNPKIIPELYYENNEVDFENYLRVAADSLSPLLDVTIDGRYVANGDFISPNPFILIKIEDENQYVFKTDTLGISVILSYPCDAQDCSPQQIFLSRNDVQWFPATANTPFRIEFKPKNLPEGEYTLFVQATDQSGNKSGTEPFQISFQVKNETTFAFQSVYPNPSPDAFFFNFVLTGNVIPDNFSLQVYSSDGRSLRDFGITDVSSFYVGTNQLIWEPKDSFGNRLPPGLYIYRLQVNLNGKQFKESGKLILDR